MTMIIMVWRYGEHGDDGYGDPDLGDHGEHDLDGTVSMVSAVPRPSRPAPPLASSREELSAA
jgi:hypothetical protein